MGHPVEVSDDATLRVGRALLAGEEPPQAELSQVVEQATSQDPNEALSASRRLFQNIIEPLADRFEPELSQRYVSFFNELIARLRGLPQFQKFNDRLEAAGRPEKLLPAQREAKRFLVLSRVTLGADVAVTSVVLDGLSKAYPEAALTLACGEKSAALFRGTERLSFLPIEYARGGSLLERLEAWVDLSQRIETWAGNDLRDCLVVNPDSRLTQLGLLPSAPAGGRAVSFDSRSYGGVGDESIAELTSRWMQETFGAADAMPFIAPCEADMAAGRRLREKSTQPLATLNWGFGGNESKRVSADFETAVVLELLRRGWRVVLDKGAGEAEASAAASTAEAAGAQGYTGLELFSGPLSGFAGVIAASDLFVGYDSAAGHIAAAQGVAGIDVFRGAVSGRMQQRWAPWGKQPAEVVAVSADETVERTLARVTQLLPT